MNALASLLLSNCQTSVKLLIFDTNFELSERINPAMHKLDVWNILGNRCQTVLSIGCPATIELTDSNEGLPETFIIIDEPECC